MENVPWHSEVLYFVEQLASRLGSDYGVASEHEHSNCVLLAHNKFRVDGAWHTWIDYPRFHALVQRHYDSGGADSFDSADYMAPTPAWAVMGSAERGFDPDEKRFHRNRNKAGANDG